MAYGTSDFNTTQMSTGTYPVFVVWLKIELLRRYECFFGGRRVCLPMNDLIGRPYGRQAAWKEERG